MNTEGTPAKMGYLWTVEANVTMEKGNAGSKVLLLH